eukprot:6694970-Heterocapsa_arctica.AAC.1
MARSSMSTIDVSSASSATKYAFSLLRMSVAACRSASSGAMLPASSSILVFRDALMAVSSAIVTLR